VLHIDAAVLISFAVGSCVFKEPVISLLHKNLVLAASVDAEVAMHFAVGLLNIAVAVMESAVVGSVCSKKQWLQRDRLNPQPRLTHRLLYWTLTQP